MKNILEFPLIGAHTSTSGGLHKALEEGFAIGANTVQIFTSNQKQWKGRVLTEEDLEKWQKAREETGISIVMSHDSYLINLGAKKSDVLERSRRAFIEEIERCQALDIAFLNFHPGSAVGGSVEECLDRIVESVLLCEGHIASNLMLLIETMAGQGSQVGFDFEHIAYIVERTKRKIPIGVCIDTCHSFAAGYDLRTKEGLDRVLDEFDRVVGLEFLKAFHLNDSAKGLNSRVDRHKPLGEGELGIACFQAIMRDPRLVEMPKYLETPGGPDLWVREIQLLKGMM